ncbi:hypothetical protein FXO38_00310 [Capsicum annuum]|nr:hypothetical protein FXO38_00310 [Capsicum annuum]
MKVFFVPENLKGVKITIMERVKENEQVRKEEEANNSSVTFSALREDVINVLDFMERLKNEEDQKAVDNLCVNVRDFHGLILNGYVECEIVEYVLPQFQLMDERVGLFFWNSQTYGDSRLFKLAHILMKIIPIELEVMQLCHTNLKASTSAEVGRFIKHLLEISPDILREYLIHLQEHIINFIIATTPGARNIHVMIEFLLIFLTDMPKDFIHVRVGKSPTLVGEWTGGLLICTWTTLPY